jgi:hypothetical protein
MRASSSETTCGVARRSRSAPTISLLDATRPAETCHHGDVLDRVVASGVVPVPVLRAGIRAVCAMRLVEERRRDVPALIAELRAGEVAVATDAANAQHYEVPAAFFTRVLGQHLKYSICHWPRGIDTLDDAETAMLELSCARGQ